MDTDEHGYVTNMSAESKCNCQHCNGHIAFPTEMAGQFINCPHCQLETRLFIAPVASVSEKSVSTGKNKKIAVLLVLIVFLACAAVAFFLKNSQKQIPQDNVSNLPKQTTSEVTKIAPSLPEQSNLKPVNGAFGWKLGDKFLGHGTTYEFTPKEEMPPFNDFHLSLTEDGRIAEVSAVALNVSEDDRYEFKRSLVSLLTEKYGLQLHDPNESEGDSYYFGTDERKAHLAMKDGIFNLDFYDRDLFNICCDEYNARIKKEDANKTAPLSKQLQ
jgi:hypothetical protein